MVNEKVFSVDNKKVTVFPSKKENSPIIYLNSNKDIGLEIYNKVQQNHRDINLVTVDGLSWNTDLTPWPIPPVFKGDDVYSGGADIYLKQLTQVIVPESESYLQSISWRGIAGYSLAGLFALYAAYQTDLFSRIASVSGSLWYPNFLSYAKTHDFLKDPKRIYLSLGSKEAKVRNPILQTVKKNTEELADFYKEKGIDVLFEINPGNHFQNAVERITKALLWLI